MRNAGEQLNEQIFPFSLCLSLTPPLLPDLSLWL